MSKSTRLKKKLRGWYKQCIDVTMAAKNTDKFRIQCQAKIDALNAN